MKLLTPQPNQHFFHLVRTGNSYHSGPDRIVTPLTSDDEATLRGMGCVDEVAVTPLIDVSSFQDKNVLEPNHVGTLDDDVHVP